MKGIGLLSTRSLWLIDIENLAWDQTRNTVTAERVQAVAEGIQRISWPYQKQEVIASSPHLSGLVGFSWGRPVRLLQRPGMDGADKELIQVISTENIAGRFGVVVIASGDNIFTEEVIKLKSKGAQVFVAATELGHLSKKLESVAHGVIQLPSGTPPV